jgi:hypothetical protein
MIKDITALGTSGKVEGKLFRAKKTKGTYTLASSFLKGQTNKPLHHKENHVKVNTLEEAHELLKQGDHSIRLYNDELKQRNLRCYEKVTIVR